MAQWRGPAKYRLEVAEMDLRPGGSYKNICHGASGERHVFFGEFQELEIPRLLVMTFGYEGVDGSSVERLELNRLDDGQTRLVATSTYDSREHRDAMLQGDAMEAGTRESYERLDALTSRMQDRTGSDQQAPPEAGRATHSIPVRCPLRSRDRGILPMCAEPMPTHLTWHDKRRVIMILPLAFAAAGTCVFVAWTLGAWHPALDTPGGGWLPPAVSFAAAATCLIRAAFYRERRVAWLALGTGLALSATGDALWQLDFQSDSKVAYPSPADIGYLSSYLFFYVGLALLFRLEGVRLSVGNYIDGAIGALAAGALATTLLAPALVGLTAGDMSTALMNLAYPIADLLLISLIVGFAVLSDRRPSWQLLMIGAGLTLWGIADGVYLVKEAKGTYSGSEFFNSFWLFGSLLIAAAAIRRKADRGIEEGSQHSIVFSVISAIVATFVLTWDHFDRLSDASIVLAILTLIAVCVRLLLSFAENRRLLDLIHDEAVTDALTGLGNRRRLFRHLDERLEQGTEPFLFALFDLDGFKAYNDSFGHPAGDLLLQRVSANLAAAVAPVGSAYRLGGDEFCVLITPGEGGAEQALSPAEQALTEVGAGFTVSASYGSVSLPAETRDAEEAMRRADRRMYAAKGPRMTAAKQQTRSVLLRVLEEREPALGEHLAGVASLAVAVGRRLGFKAEDLDVLARAAEMHDVGKIAIPDDVLQKPGPLDQLERELMRTHTIIGERILGAAPALAGVAAIVRSTHEKWDGSGYPDGLAAEEIPVCARVISVCDAFDAMTQERPYRSPKSQAEALAELKRCAGTQFDPAIVEYVCKEIASRGSSVALRSSIAH